MGVKRGRGNRLENIVEHWVRKQYANFWDWMGSFQLEPANELLDMPALIVTTDDTRLLGWE